MDCDKKVGRKNNLGEEKIVILLQVLRYFYPNKVYMFCSDDRKARTGMLSISNIPCKSVMSIFWDMHKNGFSKDDAFKYFLPLKKYLTKDGQTLGNIRVYDKKCVEQLKVPCQQVFDDIFNDKFDSLLIGLLRYI